MEKLSLTIDVSKIDKDKITTNTYTDKNGNTVIQKLYRMEVIPLKQPKFIKETQSGYKIVKTHFIVENQTKEEREAKKESNFLGDGIVFEKAESDSSEEKFKDFDKKDTLEDIDPEDIPF